MGVDQSKKKLGLKPGVEKGIRSEILRVGPRLVWNIIRLHVTPKPVGDAGERVSDYLYPKARHSRSRARTTGEQRSREKRIKRRKPKEKSFTLSSPISPPYYHRFAFFKLALYDFHMWDLYRCSQVRNFSFTAWTSLYQSCFALERIMTKFTSYSRMFQTKNLIYK